MVRKLVITRTNVHLHSSDTGRPDLGAASVPEHSISILRQQSTIYPLFCTISRRQQPESLSSESLSHF